MPRFFATSDVLGLAIKILPFQFSEKDVPLQIGQLSFSTKSLHFLHTFRAMVYSFSFFLSSFTAFFALFSSFHHSSLPRNGWRIVNPIFGLDMSL